MVVMIYKKPPPPPYRQEALITIDRIVSKKTKTFSTFELGELWREQVALELKISSVAIDFTASRTARGGFHRGGWMIIVLKHPNQPLVSLLVFTLFL